MISLNNIIILSILIPTILSLSCDIEYCKNITCTELKCASNEIQSPNGACGCCDVCKKIIGENESCAEPNFVAGQTSNTVICADGLYCDYEFGRVCKKWTPQP